MYKMIVLTAVITSLVMNSVFYIVTRKPTIATVDIVAITTDFIQKEARKNHSNHEKERAIKAFSHRLETALDELSYSKNLVLLPKEAVIKGSPDYTTMLSGIVAEELKP